MQDHYSAPQNLPAAYEALLELLREREQLLLDYVAALQLPYEQHSEWNRNTWKKYARNQLALLQALRPLTYTDYRHRVTILSPSLGVVGPDRLVTGWMLDSAQQLRREAEEAAALALFGEAEPLAGPAPALMEPLPLPVPPVVDEPLINVDEFHSAPDFKGVFLSPTATVEEVERLVDGLFSWNGNALGEDNPTLGELYYRKRALLLERAPALSTTAAAPVNDANREAAIELRKRNRAKLRAIRPAVIDALNSPTLICNPFTCKPPQQ